MSRFLRTAALAVFAAGLWSCASAPPPSPPAPVPAPAPEPEPAPVAAEVSWLVGSKYVNVRETASTKSPTVARFSKGARLTSFEEKEGWLHVKLTDTRTGWIRKDLLRKDDGCLPDRREVLLTPPMLHMSEGSGAQGSAGAKGKVVVEADIDESGKVRPSASSGTRPARRSARRWRRPRFRASRSSPRSRSAGSPASRTSTRGRSDGNGPAEASPRRNPETGYVRSSQKARERPRIPPGGI